MISWKNHFLYQIDYQHWANDVLFECLDKLGDDARRADEGMFFKSINGTLNHMLVFNLLWWGRMRGENPDLRPDQSLHEEYRELKVALKQAVRHTQHWLEAQPGAFFEGETRYTSLSGKERINWVHEVLTHYVNHMAHHRGQISAVATRLGAPTPDLDYLYYRHEMQASLANARLISANGK